MKFDQLRHAIAHLLPRLYEHPFNQALMKGSLERYRFKFYLEQDFLYLNDFAKALLITSSRMTRQEHSSELKKFSNEVTSTQYNLHRKYLGESQSFRFFQRRDGCSKKIPVIENYTNHLILSSRVDPVGVAIASLVPCFYLYNEFGRKMINEMNHSHLNPYELWILSYSNKQFSCATQSIIRIFEEVSSSISDEEQNSLVLAFTKSTEFEISFLDSIFEMQEQSNELTSQRRIQAR